MVDALNSLEGPVTVLSIVKDENPTGYLSNVHFATVEYGKMRTKIDLFIKAAHDLKFKVTDHCIVDYFCK